MAIYDFSQLETFAKKAGFTSIEIPIIAAIALAESNGNSAAHNQHGPTSTSLAENSYGLLQINLLAHPDVSVNDALDPQKAFDEAMKLFRARGNKFTDWSTWTSGAFLAKIPQDNVPDKALNQAIFDFWTTEMGLNPFKRPTGGSTKDPFLNFINALSNIPVIGGAFNGLGPGLEDLAIRTSGVSFALLVILAGVAALVIAGVTDAASTKAGKVGTTLGGFALAGRAAGSAVKAPTAPQEPPIAPNVPYTSPATQQAPMRQLGPGGDPGATNPGITQLKGGRTRVNPQLFTKRSSESATTMQSTQPLK